MKKHKKVIFETLFFIGIFLLTLYSVFFGEDLGAIADGLGRCNKAWLSPAILCVVIFICGEAVIIWHLMKTYGIKTPMKYCILFSSVGFFFSCVTPSASGGQPMQVYFMKRKNIPIPVASVVLMVVTIAYKMVLVITGLLLLIFGHGFIVSYLGEAMWIFYLGIFLNVGFIVLLLFVMLHQTFALRLTVGFNKFLEKLRIIKKKPDMVKKVIKSMRQYRESAAFMKTHLGLMVNVFIITIIQRYAMFAVTYFVYKAFALSGTPWYRIILLQAVVAICVDMLPLPGGMGISESLFRIMFENIFGAALLLPGLILSRGIGYYVELIFSALLTVVAFLVLKDKSGGAGIE